MNKSELTSLEILQQHYDRTKQPFEVQYLKGKVAKKREPYPDGNKNMIEICNQRTVLPDEVVIDLDGNTTLENGELRKETEYRLNLRGYTYEVWHSGNKGLHYHLFFPELLGLPDLQRKYVKAKFLALFKDLKADQQLKSDRVNIQMENAPHRKTFMPKQLLEIKLGRRHSIPKKWLSESFKASHRAVSKNKIRTDGRLHPKAKQLLNSVLTDARKRVAFYLAAHLRNAYGDKNKVFEILSEWNERQSVRQSNINLWSTIHSVFNSNETPGNQYLEDIMQGVEVIE
jgi:hypothetical protein